MVCFELHIGTNSDLKSQSCKTSIIFSENKKGVAKVKLAVNFFYQ